MEFSMSDSSAWHKLFGSIEMFPLPGYLWPFPLHVGDKLFQQGRSIHFSSDPLNLFLENMGSQNKVYVIN